MACLAPTSPGLLWFDLAYTVVLEITEARLLEAIALGLRCFRLLESDMVVSCINDWWEFFVSLEHV